jgi:hypothetical protein
MKFVLILVIDNISHAPYKYISDVNSVLTCRTKLMALMYP